MNLSRYDELFLQGRDALFSGAVSCEAPPVNGTPRWGIAAVLRPYGAAARIIDDMSRKALSVAGGSHWPTGFIGSSHFTLRPLECHRWPVADNDEALARYESALIKAACEAGPIRLRLTGLTVTPGTVMMCTIPETSAIEDMYLSFTEALGGDAWFDAALQRNIWYANLIHFTHPVSDPERLVNWVSGLRGCDFGISVHNEIELVTWTFTGERIMAVTRRTVPLGRASERNGANPGGSGRR